jgi:hypothetical protein
MLTLTLTEDELAFLLRCVRRDLDEFERSSWRAEIAAEVVLEAARGQMMMRTLKRAEQEQVLTH